MVRLDIEGASPAVCEWLRKCENIINDNTETVETLCLLRDDFMMLGSSMSYIDVNGKIFHVAPTEWANFDIR